MNVSTLYSYSPELKHHGRDLPALSSFAINVAHLFSVSSKKLLHSPIHYYQYGFVVEHTKRLLLGLFLFHSPKQVSFPNIDCLHCAVHVKY